ncbi:MAG: Hsp20/alpha crystallin family protein [Gammaproteobacteria bacterium]|nr:Hsp20/alpha crystallin family protein [Gammaproteobacteria bacterium]MBA3732216.1 Hsp20/alpha crystallin family protein [Gammaproteobacteria bacterium]
MKDSEISGWMWAEACQLIDQADRLQRQFFRVGVRNQAPAWEPPTDIFETDEEVSICIALPGVAPDQVQVTLESDVLSVSGVRLSSPPSALIHRLEIPYGRFERRMRLPLRELKLAQSVFENGLLSLTLHKR